MHAALLGDGSRIDIEMSGEGVSLLLPTNRSDPASSPLIEGLASVCRVVTFDYERHVLAHAPAGMPAVDAVARDLLSIADAAGASSFCYAARGRLAVAGPELARVSDRVIGIALGGVPLLAVPPAPEPDDAQQSGAARFPKLLVMGPDGLPPSEVEGNTHSPAAPSATHRGALERGGWVITTVDGVSSPTAMTPLTVLLPWLESVDAQERLRKDGLGHGDPEPPPPPSSREPGGRAGAPHPGTAPDHDPVTSYLASCGIPAPFIDDAALRSAAGRLLHLRATTPLHRDSAARDEERPARPCTGSAAGSGNGSEDEAQPLEVPRSIAAAAAARREELIEVAIITRFNELRSLESERLHAELERPRLCAAKDD